VDVFKVPPYDILPEAFTMLLDNPEELTEGMKKKNRQGWKGNHISGEDEDEYALIESYLEDIPLYKFSPCHIFFTASSLIQSN
jgi:hypothetical protein